MDKNKELNIALDIIESTRDKKEKLRSAFNNQVDFYDYFSDILDKTWDLVCRMTYLSDDDCDHVCNMLHDFETRRITREQFFNELREVVEARVH